MLLMSKDLNAVLRVKRDRVVESLTCPLCNQLLVEATTISECLHTFCRKCIYDTITMKEVDRCPVCKVDFAYAPLKKILRPDDMLQKLRNIIFPLEGRKNKELKKAPCVSKGKLKSISFEVVRSCMVSTRATVTGTRPKPTRKASDPHAPIFLIENPIEEDEESLEDDQDISSSLDTSDKSFESSGQLRSSFEDNQSIKSKGIKNVVELHEVEVELWVPLSSLPVATKGNQSFQSNVERFDAKRDSRVKKAKTKEKGYETRVEAEKDTRQKDT